MKVSIAIPFFLATVMILTAMEPSTLDVAGGKNGISLGPTADAGDNIKTPENKMVRLDGSRSQPAFGQTIESFTWEVISKQKNVPQINLFNEDTIEASFRAPEVTRDLIYIFRLVVTDNQGHSDSDTVSVHVFDVNPITITPGQDANFTLSCPPFCLGKERVQANNLTSTDDPFALIFPGSESSTKAGDVGNGAVGEGGGEGADDDVGNGAVGDGGGEGADDDVGNGAVGDGGVSGGGEGADDDGNGVVGEGDGVGGEGGEEGAEDVGNGVVVGGEGAEDDGFIKDEGLDNVSSIVPEYDKETEDQTGIIDTTSNTTAFFVAPKGTVSYVVTGLGMNETHIIDVKNKLRDYIHEIKNITEANTIVTDNTLNATLIFISNNGNVSYVSQLVLNSTDLVFLKDLLTQDYLPATGNITNSTDGVDE